MRRLVVNFSNDHMITTSLVKMATYVSVPLKRTWEVDLVKPLRNFIASTFTDSNPDDYNSGLAEIQKLRNSMISKSVDKHESALEVLYRCGWGWASASVKCQQMIHHGHHRLSVLLK